MACTMVMTILSASVGWAAPNLDSERIEKAEADISFTQFFSPYTLEKGMHCVQLHAVIGGKTLSSSNILRI
ncbi:hypothetical protein NC651_019051 [Populus alba x Populus x berolinensis]|nr:hypothetical protein NC651_019051 [Populus alba x Populus x berolinensis]